MSANLLRKVAMMYRERGNKLVLARDAIERVYLHDFAMALRELCSRLNQVPIIIFLLLVDAIVELIISVNLCYLTTTPLAIGLTNIFSYRYLG